MRFHVTNSSLGNVTCVHGIKALCFIKGMSCCVLGMSSTTIGEQIKLRRVRHQTIRHSAGDEDLPLTHVFPPIFQPNCFWDKLLLRVRGAPLALIHVSSSDPLPHLSIKNTPIVRDIICAFIRQRYTVASS
ncbi:unnamed protein product [Brassica oleracea]